jgi:predicted Rossmann-fold nucleotide-binding protein
MKQLLEHTVKEKFMEPEILDMCKFLEKPEEIFDYIEQYSAKK